MHENLKKQKQSCVSLVSSSCLYTCKNKQTNKQKKQQQQQTNKQRAKEGQRVTLNKWEQLSKELKCILH